MGDMDLIRFVAMVIISIQIITSWPRKKELFCLPLLIGVSLSFRPPLPRTVAVRIEGSGILV